MRVASASCSRPGAIAHLVRHLKTHTGLKVEMHCHNDFGLAVANVLAGYEAGAAAIPVRARDSRRPGATVRSCRARRR